MTGQRTERRVGVEKTTAILVKGRDDRARGKGGCDGGRRGGRGGSARLRSHSGGPVDPGGIRRLGEIQRWNAPQWDNSRQPGVAYTVEKHGVHASAAIQCAKQESRAPLCSSAGGGTHNIPAALLERREVCCLSYGDPQARLARHQILQDTATDQPMA